VSVPASSPAPAIRAAAEKLRGATTATPAPMIVKPITATGHDGANTVTARPPHATTAPVRSTPTAPYRATTASPTRRHAPLARR
jgi:hypothetical protein